MNKVILLCMAAVLPALAQSQPGAAAPKPPRVPIFVTAEQLPAITFLTAPPANDSWRTLAELAELHRLQETRTPTQIAHAQADDREESMFLFTDLLGPKFTRGALPLTAALSDHIKNDESVIVNPAKNYFKRPRPFHLDPSIRPVCKATENRADYSYPSGHGTTGYLEAMVLARMLPEMRNAILARADDYALSREICGVHYPSDEAASKMVAHAMIGIIFNNPRFRTELEAATRELRLYLGYPAKLPAE